MNNLMEENGKKYPKGHFVGMWMGIGIAVFSGLGIPLCVVTDNFSFIGFGPALGVAVGMSIGQGIENKYARDGRIRPLNDSERRMQRIGILLGVVLLTLGIIAFSVMYLGETAS